MFRYLDLILQALVVIGHVHCLLDGMLLSEPGMSNTVVFFLLQDMMAKQGRLPETQEGGQQAGCACCKTVQFPRRLRCRLSTSQASNVEISRLASIDTSSFRSDWASSLFTG